MIAARSLLAIAAMGSVLVAAAPARAELATWDQSKVTELAKRFADATNELYDTFYKQPPPTRGSMQSRAYAQLRQKVRALRVEAGSLAGDLAKGEGYEETLPSYDSLMELVRDARRNSQRVFTTTDVQQKATAARLILNQLTPYYDPDAEPLGPAAR
jgi:hypothetical protein